MRTEFKELSGIFYLVNKINPTGTPTYFTYSDIIFKIENRKVTMNYAPDSLGNYYKGFVVTYQNGEAARKPPQWDVHTQENLDKLITDIINQFIEIIYKIYGNFIKYEANKEIWTLLGTINDIQKIEYETPDTILLRSAANN